MNKNDLVLLISNDAFPNMGVNTVASGLRYYYIYIGLKELGVDVKVAFPIHHLEMKWKEKHKNSFYCFPGNPDYFYYRDDLQKVIKKSKAKFVIFCNGLHGDKIFKTNDVKYIYDMFAAKLFEILCESKNGFESIDIKSYTKRKQLALSLADGFIVNGKKKLPYIYGFGLGSGKDFTSLPYEVIHMAVKPSFRKGNQCQKNIAIAGAQQRWTTNGPWINQLYEFLIENKDFNLHILTPRKQILEPRHNNEDKNDVLEKIKLLENTLIHNEKSYSDYVIFLHKMDLVIDLFEKNVEREHAIVSRTVNAICCGIPVIHSSFTETSDLIIQYDAGWIIDEKGSQLKEVLSKYHVDYDKKVNGAKSLALTEFNYKINAKKILNLLKKL